jgi:hypothetical protein
MGAATGSQTNSKLKRNMPSRKGAGYRANLARLGFKNFGFIQLVNNQK